VLVLDPDPDRHQNGNRIWIGFIMFRDMVVTCQGRDLAANLVDCLVQRYLGDSASTDAIR
jgi:hypothetical protein